MANGDDAQRAASPPPDAVATPYLAQQPDGSTATFVLHTNRAPSQGDVADYAASQGHAFVGFPEAPPAAPAAAAPPPAPAPETPPSLPPPQAAPAGLDVPEQAWMRTANPPPDTGATALAQRGINVMFPQRTFMSQAPSIGGAVSGGMAGASLALPYAPLAGPFAPLVPVAGAIVGGALGGGAGEAIQYAGERLGLVPQAEPGTFGQRTGAAAIRGAGGEIIQAPFRLPVGYAEQAIRPTAEAASRLEPILTGAAPTAAPAGTRAAEALAPGRYQLAKWWADNAAGKAPGEILKAWEALKSEGQALTAGEHLGDMQTLMSTIARGGQPWVGPWGRTGALGAFYSVLQGGPHAATAGALTPVAYDILEQAPQKLMTYAVRNPGGASWLASLPRRADLASPFFSVPLRVGAQTVAASQAPPATQLLP